LIIPIIGGSLAETVPSGTLELVAGKKSDTDYVLFGGVGTFGTVTVHCTGMNGMSGVIANGKTRVRAEKITAITPTDECTPDKIVSVLNTDVSVSGDVLDISAPLNCTDCAAYLTLTKYMIS
jgi:threonine dehydrogenase-like Zn-dependent dehydrogenase